MRMREIDYLFKNDHNNIVIYVPENDHVLNYTQVHLLAKQYHIPYYVVPNAAHNALIDKDTIWLPAR